MAVLDPVKLTIINYPEDKTETFVVDSMPNKPEAGTHELTFSRHLLIERDDFMIDPPKSTTVSSRQQSSSERKLYR